MLQRLQAAFPEGQLSLKNDEPLVVTVKHAGEWDDARINLHRIFQFCQTAEAADCEISKTEFVTKITKPQPKPTRDSLRVVVRDQDYLDYLLGVEKSGKGDLSLHEPIGEGLHVLIAFDSPDAIGMVGTRALQELGLSQAEAWQLAKRQTAQRLPAIPTADQLSKGAIAYQDEGYLASLLVDLDDWAKLSKSVGPDLFVTAVSDQFVMVGKMSRGPKLNQFKQTVIEDCAAQERCISPHIYRFHQGRWMVAE